MYSYILWFILGLLSSGVLIFYARSYAPKSEGYTLSIGLFIVAIVYIGFALVWGSTNWVGIEILGVLFYGLLAWLGIRKNILWTAFGWALHPVWDLGLHLWGPGYEVVPEWYAIACISFDASVALYILYSYQRIVKDSN